MSASKQVLTKYSAAAESGESLFSDILPTNYSHLEVQYDGPKKTLWVKARHPVRPSYTIEALKDYLHLFRWVAGLTDLYPVKQNLPVKFLISASTTPGIFCLGGDLPLFVQLIKSGNREKLRYYAQLCIENQFLSYSSFHLPIINIALLQGSALGGGLEFALTHDLVIAEKDVQVGFPESRFNLFPGMGAYSLLARHGLKSKFVELIREGKVFSSQELSNTSLIDIIAEKGNGMEEVKKTIERLEKNFGQYYHHFVANRLLDPLPKEELYRLADYWVDVALRLKEEDLRKMQVLGRAQDKKLAVQRKPDYVLPTTEVEARRLSDQASVFEPATRRLLERIGLAPGSHCLDIGCGPGDVMQVMGEIVGSKGIVTGIDINESLGHMACSRLNRTGSSQYSFIGGDIMKSMPVQSSSQDLTFARFLLLHLADPHQVLQRMWEMTKPGGYLVVMDYDFRSMDAEPYSEVISELAQVIIGVFEKMGLDPHIGTKLPRLFETAGIGRPDEVEIISGQRPISEVSHVLTATLEGFLPAARKLGVIDEEKASKLTKGMDQLKQDTSTFFLLPLVGACWKQKRKEA